MFKNKFLVFSVSLFLANGFLPGYLEGVLEPLPSCPIDYTQKTCLQLEAAFGADFTSAGGKDGLDFMFSEIPLAGKKALEIGSWLGGTAFYLAENHQMEIDGLSINPWVVAQAKSRTPEHLQVKLNFLQYPNDRSMIGSGYDLIYSKEVLKELESKEAILQSCYKLLSPNGLLVTTDWIFSADEKDEYIKLMEKSGFTALSIRNDSEVYRAYVQQTVIRLLELKDELIIVDVFTESEWEMTLAGYEAVLDDLVCSKTNVYRFVMQK